MCDDYRGTAFAQEEAARAISGSDPQAKRKIAAQVFIELDTHAQLEETVFYPAFEEEADEEGQQLVAESLEEYQMVEELIKELRDLEAADAEFDAKFHALMENVQHHTEQRTALGGMVLIPADDTWGCAEKSALKCLYVQSQNIHHIL